MSELYNLTNVSVSSGTIYYKSVFEILNFWPSIAILIVVFFGVLYFSRENGIFKSFIAASALTFGISLILLIVNMTTMTVVLVPFGLLVLSILLTVFVGD